MKITDLSYVTYYICSLNKSIKDFNKSDCQSWAAKVKSHNLAHDLRLLPEIIAVIIRAVELHDDYKPRDVQILSILVFLQAKDKGRLAQILTGEGKSTIVAMFAIFRVLQGEKVDIATSSSLLGSRDHLEKKSLYALFHITVDDNWDKDGVKRDNCKKCYEADVVYGDLLHFQWDILRKVEGTNKNLRDNRPYNTIIIDEVDSMFVDGFSHRAMISMARPGMDCLELLLAAVWQQLIRIEQYHLKNKSNINQNEFKPILKQYVQQLINDPNSGIIIPKHLKELAIYQADQWVESAIISRYRFQLGRDYVISRDEGHSVIAPVDYHNTGVIQKSVWRDGLHQFLQIKHNLAISVENIFDNSISNVSYIKRYGNKIYGMTGTMGDKSSQIFLETIYPVDLVFIPTYRQKRFKEIPGIVSENWSQDVIYSALIEAKKRRAVLIICESINDVDHIESEFRKINATGINIKRYSRNDNNEISAVEEKANAGDIVIATNLAGRGTDIKTSDAVEEHGGLHVIIAFLPSNKRVEDQAFGRTSRNGNLGTGQIIADEHKLAVIGSNINDIKSWRDRKEKERIKKIISFDVKLTLLKDRLHDEFNELIIKLCQSNNNKVLISTISDQFGFWLKKWEGKIHLSGQLSEKAVSDDFIKLKESLEKSFHSSEIYSPYDLIIHANKDRDNASAISGYSKAIELDHKVSAQAYYNRAFAHLRKNNRHEAINDLLIAKQRIEEDVIAQHHALQLLINLNPEQTTNYSESVQHVQNKINVYKKQIDHIDKTIKQVSNAKSSSDLIVRTNEKLYEVYEHLQLPLQQATELYQSGLYDFYDVEEQVNDSNLFGCFIVACLGIMQIVAGAVITVASLGTASPIGMALISEGIGDILFAVRSMIDGHFSWDAYLSTKAVSVGISIITMGIDVIKSSRIARSAGVVAAGEPAKLLTKQQYAEIVKNGVKEAIVHAGIKEVINVGIDYLSKAALKSLKSEIREKIEKDVCDLFEEKEIQLAIDKLQSYDGQLITQVKQLVPNMIHSKAAIKSIAQCVFTGVIGRQHAEIGAVFKLAEIAGALDKIINLTDAVCNDFRQALIVMSQHLPATSKKYPEIREMLRDYLINTITDRIMSALHGQIVSPATNMMLNDKVNALSQKIQKAIAEVKIEVVEEKSQSLVDKPHRPQNAQSKNSKERLVSKPGNEASHKSCVLIDDFDQGRTITFNSNLNSTQNNTHETKNVPLFHNLGNIKPEIIPFISRLSVKDIKNLDNQNLIYVITKNKEIIATFPFLKFPYNLYAYALGSSTFVSHAELARGQDVYAAGEIHVKQKIFDINNCSGHYQPNGEHLNEFVLNEFSYNGLSAENIRYSNSCGPNTVRVAQESSFISDTLAFVGTKFNEWHVVDRSLGFLQCVGGVAQIGTGVMGGIITAKTGIGPYLGTSLAVMGVDNAFAGCTTAWTGEPQATLLNQGLQGFGFNDQQVAVIEIGLNMSPFFAPTLVNATHSQLKQFGLFGKQLAADAVNAAQEFKTYATLRNGNIFASPTLFHSRSSETIAKSVFTKIDPARFNPETRFKEAFYASTDWGTTTAELGYHRTRATHGIQFNFKDREANILDLTQHSIAKKWDYIGGNDYNITQKIAEKAKQAGYNVILFSSERKPGGTNVAILDNFEELVAPRTIFSIPKKQSR